MIRFFGTQSLKSACLFTLVFGLYNATLGLGQTYTWRSVRGAPANGAKQDGVCFIHPDTGWVVNGSGRIYRTLDGGTTWIQQRNTAGTYFRAVHFINGQVGFAGNIGPNYFPGVTDTAPLYRTIDGGNSWVDCSPDITGPMPTGICAIDAPTPQVIYAGGRVGGPGILLKSTDGGQTWAGIDINAQAKMILDIHFVSADTGFVFAGTNANIALANALILGTTNGGLTWAQVYRGTRPYEITWKASFPSRRVGYATVQSYNTGTTQRHVLKTSDGGTNWQEIPLVNSGIRTFGIGFVNDSTGWVGGETTGYETQNGGSTWRTKALGQYANKFSIVPDRLGGKTGYAVGINVFKLTTTPTAAGERMPLPSGSFIHPNPTQSGSYVSINLADLRTETLTADLVEAASGKVTPLFTGRFMGLHESPFMYRLPEVAKGVYTLRLKLPSGKRVTQRLVIN